MKKDSLPIVIGEEAIATAMRAHNIRKEQFKKRANEKFNAARKATVAYAYLREGGVFKRTTKNKELLAVGNPLYKKISNAWAQNVDTGDWIPMSPTYEVVIIKSQRQLMTI